VASYSLRIKLSAGKELDRVGQTNDRQRIVTAIRALGDEPRPRGVEKLSGSSDLHHGRGSRRRQRGQRVSQRVVVSGFQASSNIHSFGCFTTSVKHGDRDFPLPCDPRGINRTVGCSAEARAWRPTTTGVDSGPCTSSTARRSNPRGARPQSIIAPFLCRNGADKDWVEKLAEQHRVRGIRGHTRRTGAPGVPRQTLEQPRGTGDRGIGGGRRHGASDTPTFGHGRWSRSMPSSAGAAGVTTGRCASFPGGRRPESDRRRRSTRRCAPGSSARRRGDRAGPTFECCRLSPPRDAFRRAACGEHVELPAVSASNCLR
jgi:hypothetical protein